MIQCLNDNYNRYPIGENINTYSEETEEINDKNNRVIKLSGKKDELHIFLRGGYIIPMQETLNKYVMNTFYLRHQKLNDYKSKSYRIRQRNYFF